MHTMFKNAVCAEFLETGSIFANKFNWLLTVLTADNWIVAILTAAGVIII